MVAEFDKTKYADSSTNRLLFKIKAALNLNYTAMPFPRELYEDTSSNRLLWEILNILGGDVLIDVDGGFDVPEHVATLTFTSPNAQIFDVGTAPGANDIFAAVQVIANQNTDATINRTNSPGTKYYVSANNDLTIKIRV